MNSIAKFLYRWQWVLLLVAAPFLLFPTIQRSWVLLIVPLLLIIIWVVSRKPLPGTSINLPLLILLIMVLVSLYATYDLSVSFANLSGLILGFGLFFGFVYLIQVEKGISFALIIYILFGLGIAGVSLFAMQQVVKIGFLAPLVALLPASLTYLPGEESGFHPNIVAGSMLWLLPLLLVLLGWLLLKGKQIYKRVRPLYFWLFALLVSLSFLFVAFVFLLTQSRTGFIALFLSLATLLLFLLPPKWRVYGFLLMAIGGVAISWYAWQAGWLEKLYMETTPGGGSPASFQTLNSRVGYWSQAQTIIEGFPYTGIGLNTMETISAYIYPYFSSNPGGGVTHAHNEFLQVALDVGIPGLIAFISIYMIVFMNLIAIWKKAGSRSYSKNAKGFDKLFLSTTGLKALSLGLGLSLFSHFLYGFTDAIALGTKPNILFWMLLALVCGLNELVCGNLIKNQPGK